MGLDPNKFSSIAVSDTCAVWNMLSSKRLYRAAMKAKVHFCITGAVLYECLHKPRKSNTPEALEMIRRLTDAREQGQFPVEQCDLEDLAYIARQVPRRLGGGEISCMALAYRTRIIAFMTDEKCARHCAENVLDLVVETTPKLYAWLHYHQYLGDSDHGDVIQEHEKYESRPLTEFFKHAYHEALRCRLMQRDHGAENVEK